MATQVVLFDFVSDAQSFVATPGTGVTGMTWDASNGNPVGCLTQSRTTKSNTSGASTWKRTLTYNTMGAPTSSTITGITGATQQSRFTTFTLANASTSGPTTLVDGTTTVTLSAGRTVTNSVDGAFVSTSGTDATGLSKASSNSVVITINNQLSNANSTGSSVVLKQDQLNFTLTYTIPVTIDSATPNENLAIILGNSATPVEFLSVEQINETAPLEFLVGLRKDTPVPDELQSVIQGDGNSPLEFRASLTVDGAVPVELTVSTIIVTADGAVPLEVLSVLQRNVPVPVELLSTTTRDGVVPQEDVLTLQRNVPIGIESNSALFTNTPLTVEFNLARFIDSAIPDEALLSVQLNGQMPIEWAGALLVVADSSSPIEFIASVGPPGATVPVEYIQAAQVFIANNQLALEFLAAPVIPDVIARRNIAWGP